MHTDFPCLRGGYPLQRIDFSAPNPEATQTWTQMYLIYVDLTRIALLKYVRTPMNIAFMTEYRVKTYCNAKSFINSAVLYFGDDI